jgi:hypothetical protein
MASILKVDTIQDQSGNNIINENADTITIGASGDTITIPSGATIDLSNATQTGVGGANTPAFYVTPSADQTSIADNTLTQITFGQENFDTDNAFASNTFTVPSGKGGKYFFNTTLFIESTGGSNALNSIEIYYYINDAQNIYTNTEHNPHTTAGVSHTGILNLSAGDTVKVYMRCDVSSSGTSFINQDNPANTSRCWWVGYKLI